MEKLGKSLYALFLGSQPMGSLVTKLSKERSNVGKHTNQIRANVNPNLRMTSYRAWVPNLIETMSHCPIDDREMSHCAIAHSTYLFTEVKFQGLPVYLIYKPEILNFESGEYLGSPPQGKNFEKTLQIKKCESRKCTLIDSCWTGRISLVSQVVRLNYESMRNA